MIPLEYFQVPIIHSLSDDETGFELSSHDNPNNINANGQRSGTR